jgi:hypothetical protein
MRNLLLLILAVGVLIFPIGCDKDSASSTDNSDLSDEFGGFTTSDEDPLLVDTAIVAKLSEDQAFLDPVLDTPIVDSAVTDSTAEIYAFRIVWGRLSYDSTVTTVTDWSGSLELTHGVQVVRRVINFESGHDYILPRTDPKLIEWISKTTSYHDGIFANVYISSTEKTNAAITFTTAPFTISYSLKDIDSLDTVYYLDDSNVVAIHAFRFEWQKCPKGFLAGHWGTDDSGNGIFYGSWMTHNGQILGYVKGNWGIPDTSGNLQNIFFGKYVDINGKFLGLLKGHYYFHPNWHANENARKHAGGWFAGHYYDANGVKKGDLGGRYKSRPFEEGAGFFHGRWKTDCAKED